MAFDLGPGVHITTQQRVSFTGEEALLVLLYRMAYPARLVTRATTMFKCQPGHLCDLFTLTLAHVDFYFAQPLQNVFGEIARSRLALYARQT